MKIRGPLLLIISAILFISFFYLFYNSSFFARSLYSHYNGITYWHVSNEITGGEDDYIKKLVALNDYVHQNVVRGDYFEVQDLTPLEVLTRGIGFCDQVAHLYIRLIEPLDIRGYLIFLRENPDGTGASPHSVALLTSQTKLRLHKFSDIAAEGIIVDPYQGVIYKNSFGNPATFADICSGDIPESQNKYFNDNITHDLYCNEGQIFLSNTPLSQDSRKRRIFYRYILPVLPKSAIYVYQDLVMDKYYGKIFDERSEFLYFKARNYHVYNRLSEAQKIYEAIVSTSTNDELVAKSLFFGGLAYMQAGESDKARKKFEIIIKDHADSPWLSIAERWLPEIT